MLGKFSCYFKEVIMMRKDEPQSNNSQKAPGRQSKAAKSLFPIKMIAKLERTQSTAKQYMENNYTEPHNGSNNKQRISNNRSIALEWTTVTALATGGLYQIFALNYVVGKAQTMLSSHGGFLIIAMYHHRDTI